MSNISQYYKPCEHTYDLKKASRDDQGYYLDCTKCGKTEFFQCDTWDELLQFIGYSHGRFESLLDMVASMGLTENEWEKWKKDYPNCLRQQEIDEINDYFFKMKKFELERDR